VSRSGLYHARLAVLASGFVLGLASCGGGSASAPRSASPQKPLPLPADAGGRQALDAVGRRMFAALQRRDPAKLLFDDDSLRAILVPEAATRASALRLGVSTRLGPVLDSLAQLRGARYSGICVQNARTERSAGAIGLKSDGFVFDRALVIGVETDGGRIASWVEGTFVYTNAGFGAIDLMSVEEPRREHSDLELAPCDMQAGTR